MNTHLWLRSESKPNEKRTVLPPSHAEKLIRSGFRLTVEKSSQSIFHWQDYQSVGCEIVDEQSWVCDAPSNAIILGLKELDQQDFPLSHNHIHFAHVYKNQAGWKKTLGRFAQGGGRLYDLEFLVDATGKRVAAFGHWAGFAGAGLSILAWANQKHGAQSKLGPVGFFESSEEFISEIKSQLELVKLERPKVIVIGAHGRCGRGAVKLLQELDVETTQWDVDETACGGPFQEILRHDVFLNCVFVEESMAPFITTEMCSAPSRNLSIVCDVSCDPYGDYNPVPIYDSCTTFSDPVKKITAGEKDLHLIAIDHLPSMLPRESSEDFCDQLIQHLLNLDNLDDGVWGQAGLLFDEKLSIIGT